jgi:CheY-like chemotaxis protein
MLEHIGLAAVGVSDGESAINEFINAKISFSPFNAVIMDLTISGGMGGVKTAKKIREIDKNIPLIVASGYCDDPVMSDFQSYGFNERLLKPFTLDDLRKTITSLLKNE